MAATEWDTPPRNCSVAEDEVHVWRARVDGPPHVLQTLRAVLSPDEHEKADRFHFDIDRRRFGTGRGTLRMLLAQCLGTTPAMLQFATSAFGKPHLAGDFAGAPLQFNVSHSGDIVLIVLALRRALGIDVEHMRPDIEAVGIAERFFSATERRALATLDPTQQRDAFYACWTRKEAYIKATGDGLSLPLDQFDVTLLPGEPAQLVATRPDPAEAGRWTLMGLDVGDGYKAALAVEGAGFRLKTWDWSAGSLA
jgi:4'-phosphopantetheinyl transferase